MYRYDEFDAGFVAERVAQVRDQTARRLSGDAQQVMYEFWLRDGEGRALADGRAVVVLNTPLALDTPKES